MAIFNSYVSLPEGSDYWSENIYIYDLDVGGVGVTKDR